MLSSLNPRRLFYVEQRLANDAWTTDGRGMNAITIEPPITAFKEWHLICQALQRGEQSLILRKGGIAEGRAGFAFQHREFLLFPTYYHAQYEGVRSPRVQSETSEPRDSVTFSSFCRIVGQSVLTEWDEVRRLEPFHLWKPELLRERFDYGGHSALHLAVVRTYRLSTNLTLPMEKRYGGCRSWVEVPLKEPLSGGAVIESDTFGRLYSDIANSLPTNVLANIS